MITVGAVHKNTDKELVKLSCDFTLNGKTRTLWFETSIEFESYLSLDNCDSFFVILFLLAFDKQEDIAFETPVSKKLFHGINDYLQELFLIRKRNLRRITIDCIKSETYYGGKGVATAMSFGIDSFSTFLERVEGDEKITHLSLFNAGAFGQDGGEKSRDYFNFMKKRVLGFCNELGLPLLWVDTNLNETLTLPFIETHTYRNVACALLFQELIGVYFYSSGVKLLSIDFYAASPAYFDFFNAMALSAESFDVKISGLFKSRFDKTKSISNQGLLKKYLNVCLANPISKGIVSSEDTLQNCSRCSKCIRTMVTLDVLGELASFSNVFDVDLYYKNRNKYIAEVLYHYYRSKNTYSVEIKEEMKRLNFSIPGKVYYFILLRIIQAMLNYFKSMR